jgi:DNA-directed RNA polymerase specialized sigma24 family protein
MAVSSEVSRVEEKLDRLIRLIAYQVSQGHPSLTEKAVVLRRLGLTPTEIADICGTTANTIGVRLTEAKKKQAKSNASNKRSK